MFLSHSDPNSGRTKLPFMVDKVDTLPRWPLHTNNSQEFLNMQDLSQFTGQNKVTRNIL